jgi:hypothetical protein
MTLARRATVVFLGTFAYLGWLAASRFVLVMNDEGIYLDGGLRVLHGQMPYKDFFSIAGPGTYALVAASFRVFGTTLTAARMPVLWDIAMITACLYWLVCKLSNSITALFTVLVYLPFATLTQTAVVANHRWDSSAWAILAGTLIVAAVEKSPPAVSVFASFTAGMAAGIAAWCTPPVALAAAAIGVCLVVYRATRYLVLAYAGGVVVVFTAGIVWIASRGALPAMLDSFRWTASNYSDANRTWYGSVPGGYPHLLDGTSLGGAAIAIVLLAFFTLPATLPFFSSVWFWKRPPIRVVILMAVGVALIISAYPRWDLNHLTWVSAPFYALAAALTAPSSLRNVAALRRTAALIVLLAAGSCLTITILQRLRETAQVTNLGNIHGNPADLQLLAAIQSRVTPSDTLFVFPYRPLLYFLTGAHNPTRYPFLQPGMFPDHDEAEALGQLSAHPPRWILYAHVSPQTILLTWPSTDPQRLQMPRIEAYLRENYQEKEHWDDLQLLESRAPLPGARGSMQLPAQNHERQRLIGSYSLKPESETDRRLGAMREQLRANR